MPLIQYVPDPRRYEEVFVVQTGHGPFIRYRGSMQNGSGFFPQVLKNLFSKLINFARPLVEPHAKAALEAATPHLKEAATGLVKEATSKGCQFYQSSASRWYTDASAAKPAKRLTKKSETHSAAKHAGLYLRPSGIRTKFIAKWRSFFKTRNLPCR